MPFGPVARITANAADVVAPGLCEILAVRQVGKTHFDVDVRIPAVDADDTSLTGLARLAVAAGDIVDGVDPSLGLGMADVLALPGVLSVEEALTPADAGTTRTVRIGIVDPVGDQFIVVAASDD